MENWDKLSQGQ